VQQRTASLLAGRLRDRFHPSDGAGAMQKLDALTGLRFFAALVIVIFHAQGVFHFPWIPTIFIPIQGVSFFFVLSGFILTFRYPTLSGSTETLAFLRSRFARIWPAHIAALALAMALLYGASATYPQFYSPRTLIASVALIQSWFGLSDYFMPYNPVSWSISTETAFYLLFPFLIWNFAKTWHIKLTGSLALALAMIFICQHFAVPYLDLTNGGLSMLGLVYIHPAARLFEFVLGMSAAHLWRCWPTPTLGPAMWTVIEGAAVALVLFNVPLTGLLIDVQTLSAPARTWIQTSGSIALPSTVLIFVAATGRGLISKGLGSAVMVRLGEISFSLYLVHFTVFRFFGNHEAIFAGLRNAPEFLLALAASMTLAYLIWKFVEAPSRSFISGHSRSISLRARPSELPSP